MIFPTPAQTAAIVVKDMIARAYLALSVAASRYQLDEVSIRSVEQVVLVEAIASIEAFDHLTSGEKENIRRAVGDALTSFLNDAATERASILARTDRLATSH